MIRKRGAKHVVTVYDKTVSGGKRWVGTYETRKQAVQAEAQAKLERRRKAETEESCDQFAERWLRDYPRQRESTNIGYRDLTSKFARDFQGVPLSDVSRQAARRWALDNPSRHKAVRAMFSDAVRDGITDTNPFLNMRLPQSRGRKDTEPPTIERVHQLADKARELRGPNFAAFILTAGYTGMRPGEMYALQWPRVDLVNMEIQVAESYSSKSKATTAPKNNYSRLVVLPPPARDALRQIAQPTGFVFETVTGKRLTGRTLHYQWDAVRIACGMPGLDIYELRHACATYLLNVLGIPAHQVAEQLGHTDGGVLVSKLYGHPSAALARDAIKKAFGSNVVEFPRVSGAGAGA